MLARGLGALLTLPLATAILASLIWFADETVIGSWCRQQPDQLVIQFVAAVNGGEYGAARKALATPAERLDVRGLGETLNELYGPIVMNGASVRQRTAERAVVWSYTRTAAGHRYLMNWTLAHLNGRWYIIDCGVLHDVAPGVGGA